MTPSRLSLTIVLAALARVAMGNVAPTTDDQLWSEMDLLVPINSQLSMTALVTARFGVDVKNPSLWGGGVLIERRAGPWLFTAGDVQVSIRNSWTGIQTGVNLPLAAVSYVWQLGDTVISDRSRMEVIDGVGNNPARYRNRLLIEEVIRGHAPLSRVFASDEAFYDLQGHEWKRNRVQCGVEFAGSAKQAFDIFVMRQVDKGGRLRRLNILGTTLKVEL